jgi:hypothetical protein
MVNDPKSGSYNFTLDKEDKIVAKLVQPVEKVLIQ